MSPTAMHLLLWKRDIFFNGKTRCKQLNKSHGHQVRELVGPRDCSLWQMDGSWSHGDLVIIQGKGCKMTKKPERDRGRTCMTPRGSRAQKRWLERKGVNLSAVQPSPETWGWLLVGGPGGSTTTCAWFKQLKFSHLSFPYDNIVVITSIEPTT